jgi:acetyl-CoA carboxylase beta subunit
LGIVGRRLAEQTFGTVDELYAGVERIWDEFDQGMMDRLVADFKRRLELVIAVHDRSISQLLSPGIRARKTGGRGRDDRYG